MGFLGAVLNVYGSIIRAMYSPFYVLPAQQRNLALSSLYSKIFPILDVETKYGVIKFYSPSTKVAWRVNTYHEKEPETLHWIDTFDPADVFWDIGANIGLYSLYAAKRKIKTFAFEPASSNFYLLNRNIELNDLNAFLMAYCCGLDNKEYLGCLHMSSTEPGNALSLSCTDNLDSDLHIRTVCFPVSFSQGIGTYSIDGLVRSLHIDFPNHIKIDVDGIELQILDGARETFNDSRLKSVLVELDSGDAEQIAYVLELFSDAGMHLVKKDQSEMTRKGRFSSQFNYIFSR